MCRPTSVVLGVVSLQGERGLGQALVQPPQQGHGGGPLGPAQGVGVGPRPHGLLQLGWGPGGTQDCTIVHTTAVLLYYSVQDDCTTVLYILLLYYCTIVYGITTKLLYYSIYYYTYYIL